MVISCVIIDDEPLALELIRSYVMRTPFLSLKGRFESASSALAYLAGDPVDLVFCDIQMPGMNGMDFSKMLPEGTRIVFTTAFSNYALESYKVSALDYLLKPFSYADFLASAQKALSWFEVRKAAAAMEEQQVSSIYVRTEYKLRQVDLSDIIFIEGMKDYVRIHLDGRDSLVSQVSMKSLMSQLPPSRFYRVHRSYIVNMEKVRMIEKGRIIFGHSSVPISDNEREGFYEALSKFSIMPV